MKRMAIPVELLVLGVLILMQVMFNVAFDLFLSLGIALIGGYVGYQVKARESDKIVESLHSKLRDGG